MNLISRNMRFFHCLVLFLFCLSPSFATTETSLIRYALVVGSNDGGDGRIPLRYANSDATSIADVFEELGELTPGKKTLLLNPAMRDIEDAFSKINTEIAREKSDQLRQEVIFYYSGHSDDKGLLLHDGRYSYSRLKRHLSSLDVDVRLAMLDSCEAESFMKAKGGKRIQPLVLDDSNKVKGYVFLAASSENEAAQESKSIGGSFFTHYFVSALRGAADHTEDKRVTLNEAYQYAYNETIARTKNTRAGAQHAAYDIQLKGAGDLILTDLNRSSSALALEEDVSGRVFVHNSVGRLVVELSKIRGKRLEIGLLPGFYEISLREGDAYWSSTANLKKDHTLSVSKSNFVSQETISTIARGNSDEDYFFGEVLFSHALQSDPNAKSRVSLGYMYRVIDFFSCCEDGNPNRVYQGVHASYNLPLPFRGELAIDAHYLQGKGQLFGATTMLNFNLVDFKAFSTGRIIWHVGAGMYSDFISNYYSFETAPPNQQDIVEISSNTGVVYASGVRYQMKKFGFEFLMKRKKRYSDSEKYARNNYPEFILRTGYRF